MSTHRKRIKQETDKLIDDKYGVGVRRIRNLLLHPTTLQKDILHGVVIVVIAACVVGVLAWAILEATS